MARGCPFNSPAHSVRSGNSGATIASATPGRSSTRSRASTRSMMRFFIPADEEPTINKKKFVAFCEELIARGLNERCCGASTRASPIFCATKAPLLPQGRPDPRLARHGGGRAAEARPLQQGKRKSPTTSGRLQLLRDAGIVVEAQFIVGLENRTRETLEETYRMAMDWKPDLANWSMYTPWPFTSLFRELSDKVEIYDFEKYNFVTPIIKAGGDGSRGTPRPRDAQLPTLLHVQGVLLLSLGGNGRATALSARLSEGLPQVGFRTQVLRPPARSATGVRRARRRSISISAEPRRSCRPMASGGPRTTSHRCRPKNRP